MKCKCKDWKKNIKQFDKAVLDKIIKDSIKSDKPESEV